jgi:lichenan operon transcriptional antiterminator
MIERVRLVLGTDLSKDLDLRLALGLHSEPMVKRIRYKLMMKNPLLNDIKQHKQAYETASVAAEVVNLRYGIHLSEDEIAYLALHFYIALERYKVAINRKRVLLVCSTGHGTARLLQYRFKQEFNPFLEEVVTKDALSIRNIDLSEFDLIVSTVPLSVKTITPIIYVSTLLSDQDLQALRHRFNQNESSIAEYFDRKLFYKDVLVNTKEEIIFFMAQKISEFKNFKAGFYESILRREETTSTEFGNLIAIPHPDQAFSSNTIVSVAILKKPILWKERMVQLVFMLAYGDNEYDNLDVFFAKSAQFLTSAKDINEAIQANDYDDFMKIIDRN